jgi:CheY-like chemotaxis protein
MDGSVRVESKPGKGSNFQITVKQHYAGEARIGFDVAEKLRNFRYIEAKRSMAHGMARMDLSEARVLVVDDMRSNLDVAAGQLRRYKLRADCVTSGQEAVERVEAGFPIYNMIFMDHMMPGMDGIETAGKIRAIGTDYAKSVPIVALTANAVAGVRSQFFERGFQDFLSKPIDLMALDAVLRRWVNIASLPPPAEPPAPGLEARPVIIEIPGIDVPRAMAIYNNDTAMYINILRSYALNVPETLAKLRELAPGNILQNIENCAVYAHGLKGASASIGAENARSAAAALENAAGNRNTEQALRLKDALLDSAGELLKNIEGWLGAYGGTQNRPKLSAPSPALLERLKTGCENYDIARIDEIMAELEGAEYETGSELVAWLRKQIDISAFETAVERLGGMQYG